MLKLLRRRKVTKRIFYVLAVIIIPAFVIWGSASVVKQSKMGNYAGILFGKKISHDDFREAMLGWKIQVKLQFGEAADQVLQSYFNAVDAAWSRMILLHEARARKIHVSDSEVIDMITQMPTFQRDGRFNEQTYQAFLQYYLNLPARRFEEVMRQNIALGEIFKQVTNGITVTDSEIKDEYVKQNEQTRLKYVFFGAEEEKNIVTVTDEEITALYEKSKERFRVPPQINASYCFSEFKENTPTTEKDALTKKMEAIYNDAQREGFEKAAQKAGLEIKETGLFQLADPIPSLGWFPDLSALLFDLSQGHTSKVVVLKRGAYLFNIKEKKQAYIPEFKEAKEKAREILIFEKAKAEALKKAEKFLSKIIQENLSFENAARELNLSIKETPLFSREDYIPEVGLAPALKETAFKLSSGATADHVIALDQGFFCIKNIETKKIDEEQFNKDKEKFAQTFLEQKRNKVFNNFFEELKKKAGLVNYVDEERLR